jgi:hypothetical protein
VDCASPSALVDRLDRLQISCHKPPNKIFPSSRTTPAVSAVLSQPIAQHHRLCSGPASMPRPKENALTSCLNQGSWRKRPHWLIVGASCMLEAYACRPSSFWARGPPRAVLNLLTSTSTIWTPKGMAARPSHYYPKRLPDSARALSTSSSAIYYPSTRRSCQY